MPFSHANFLSFISWAVQDWQGACYLGKWRNSLSLQEQRPSETSELTWLTQAKSPRNLMGDAAMITAKSFRDGTGDLWPEPDVSVLDTNVTSPYFNCIKSGWGSRDEAWGTTPIIFCRLFCASEPSACDRGLHKGVLKWSTLLCLYSNNWLHKCLCRSMRTDSIQAHPWSTGIFKADNGDTET